MKQIVEIMTLVFLVAFAVFAFLENMRGDDEDEK